MVPQLILLQATIEEISTTTEEISTITEEDNEDVVEEIDLVEGGYTVNYVPNQNIMPFSVFIHLIKGFRDLIHLLKIRRFHLLKIRHLLANLVMVQRYKIKHRLYSTQEINSTLILKQTIINPLLTLQHQNQ